MCKLYSTLTAVSTQKGHSVQRASVAAIVTTGGKNQKKTGRKLKNLNSCFRAQTSD